jgi:biotin operon repressor
MDPGTVARLMPKSARQTVVRRIAEDFRLPPLLAETYFDQIAQYVQLYAGLELQDNQVAYCAIDASQPAGKRLEDCVRVSVRLTLHDPSDFATAGSTSIAALRRTREQRLCEEALEQGGLLTQEDLAVLLTTSPSTVKRDLRALRAQGVLVPTRGQHRDIGPGVSHKVETVTGYLRGEPLSALGRRLHHGLDSMERYLQAFRRVALMTREGLDPTVICKACRLSPGLLTEYQGLYQQACHDPTMASGLATLLGADPSAAAKGGHRL